MRNRIAGALRSSTDPNAQQASLRISPNFVYDHPTLHELAGAIANLVSTKPDAEVRDFAEDIRAILRSYTDHLPKPLHPADGKAPEKIAVLLTGSTGNVGSHVLATLLAEPRVSTVYTLNRSGPAGRQAAAFTERGLPVELLNQGKFVSLTGDVTQERLGLDPEIFDEVRSFV